MDLKAIIQLMNNTLKFDLTMEDFTKPVPSRVQLICQAFIMYVFEIPEASMNHLPLDALSPDDDAEHLQRAAPLIILYTSMNQFIQDMAIDHPFGMCDLISPEPRKFRRLMSLLADYLKFHTNMLPHWNKTVESYQNQRDRLAEIQRQVEEASSRKEVLDTEAEARKRKEHELLIILAKKQKEFQDSFKFSTDLEAAVESHKKEEADQKFLQDELLLEKDTLEIQVEQLSLNLLASPERILNDVERFKEELIKTREQCDKQRKVNEETKTQIEIAAKVDQMINKMGGEFEQKILKEKASLECKLTIKMDADERKRESELQLQNVTDDIKKAEADWNENEENLIRDKKMHKERMEELAQQKENIEKEIDGLKKQGTNPAAEMALQREINSVRSQIREINENINTEFSRASGEYRDAMKQFDAEIISANEIITSLARIPEIIEKTLKPTNLNTFDDTANISLNSFL